LNFCCLHCSRGLEIIDDPPRCFNCGAYSHSIRECPRPFDRSAVSNARRQHKRKRNQTPGSRLPSRYYQSLQRGKYDGLKPGSLDAETRKLLGLKVFFQPSSAVLKIRPEKMLFLIKRFLSCVGTRSSSMA